MWIPVFTSAAPDSVTACRSAHPAYAHDRAVRQVRLEPVPPVELVREWLKDLELQLGVRPAATAHHVIVSCGVRPLVLRDAVVKVGVPHNTKLFEYFERAVDGGDVDVWKHAHDVLVYLVGRNVPVHARNGVKDQLPLWGDA